jgi:uncharacterized membrane protein YphA (DoxX/SURF4 family)
MRLRGLIRAKSVELTGPASRTFLKRGKRQGEVTAQTATTKRRIAIWILRLLLGLLFLSIGAAKLSSSLQTVRLFAAIGWGQWFRYLTGLVDVTGALLVFVPRWTCYGALLLACTVGLATFLYVALLHNNPSVPLALTLLAATLAWLTRPRRTKPA